ncbi:hypothetical protein DFH07DRAFT_778391 [Mycena maculata]|uniref:Uncharacterized protein n=1 Tax=Mycena maculata TaxID=230809 RepID=A0AAD7IFE2_9AGAR|nr:hypothetical protein DFH07DRAFT_778391 [Mycena maculata]
MWRTKEGAWQAEGLELGSWRRQEDCCAVTARMKPAHTRVAVKQAGLMRRAKKWPRKSESHGDHGTLNAGMERARARITAKQAGGNGLEEAREERAKASRDLLCGFLGLVRRLQHTLCVDRTGPFEGEEGREDTARGCVEVDKECHHNTNTQGSCAQPSKIDTLVQPQRVPPRPPERPGNTRCKNSEKGRWGPWGSSWAEALRAGLPKGAALQRRYIDTLR